MSRLIDADALTDELIKGIEEDTDKSIQSSLAKSVCMLICKAIERQPTIDAEPVRHGKWANDAMGVLRCSECNAQAPWRFIGIMYDEVDYRWKSNYCPNCGARMDQ